MKGACVRKNHIKVAFDSISPFPRASSNYYSNSNNSDSSSTTTSMQIPPSPSYSILSTFEIVIAHAISDKVERKREWSGEEEGVGLCYIYRTEEAVKY